MEMENLQNRKKEIIQQISEEGLNKLKFTKLLKLIENEIQELMNYWTIKQVHQMVNEVFNLNISAPLFYRFCAKNFEKLKVEKNQKTGVSQKRDTKKESILDEDELNAIAMFGSSCKNQVRD